MVPSAYLRVFERLTDQLGGPGRDTPEDWQRAVHPSSSWVAPLSAPRRSEPKDQDESSAVHTAMIMGRMPFDSADMRICEHEGNLYACPTQLEDRTAIATDELTRRLPQDVAAAMLPGAAVKTQRRLVRRLNTQQSPWAIPMSWVLLFDPVEHVAASNVLLSPLDDALAHVGRAIRVIDRFDPDRDELLVKLAELDMWLASFTGPGLVELDASALSSVKPARRAPLRAPQHPRSMCLAMTEYLNLLVGDDYRRAQRKLRAVEGSWWRARIRSHTS